MSLQIRGLSIDLGRTRIVSAVDLDVPTGQLVGLLGPNGSGKSTILKALYRVNPIAAGQVLLDDEDLLAMPARAAARRVAALAQDNRFEFDATAAEVVAIGRHPHKGGLQRDDQADRDIVAESLERVGCLHLHDRSIHSLSGGEQQRVHIARALAQGCDHLILDEPTNHLDIRYQIEVLEIVSSLGMTVLAALHDLSLAGLFCDSVALLAGGQVLATGSPTDVLTAEAIKAAYGADVLVVEHPETGTPQLIPRRTRAEAPSEKGTS